MAKITHKFELSREDVEELLSAAILDQFPADADDLSSSVTWNYTERGDLDSVAVTVYKDPAKQQS